MANPLQIANKSKLVSERAKIVFTDILNKYNAGEIKTQIELQYRVYLALEDFFTQFGKPSMKKRLAYGPPVSSDYNDMMKEVVNDLTVMFAECKEMVKALTESFNQVEVERQQLLGQLGSVQNKLNEVALRMQQQKNETVFRDSFANASLFDVEMVDGTAAAVNAAEGVLSLAKIEAEEYRENIKLTILEGNGFPGNTHQVRAVSGTYKFYGEDDMHMNLADIIDGNSDTWFEYEAFQITDALDKQMSGHGFDYKEGMSWVKKESGALRLYIEIELPIAKTINWLSLSPFLPSDKGVTPAVVRSILIQDGKGSSNEVSTGYDVLREDQVFIVPRQKCKKIILHIEQDTGYETLVGHFFFKELEESAINYMAKEKEQAGRRIEGPKPSVESLGFKYDPAGRTLIRPVYHSGQKLGSEDSIKDKLFSPPKVQGKVQAGLEAVVAKRQVIGLRDMSISSYRFAADSVYISSPFETADPIRNIALDVSATVPPEFGSGDWIEYHISIDNGKSWHPIYPRGTSKTGAKTAYVINANVPIEGRFDNTGYLDTLAAVRSVRVKATLKRPVDLKDADFYTPILKEYKLRCTTVKEVR